MPPKRDSEKPKREMNPMQLEKLAQARVKAQEVKRMMKQGSDDQKMAILQAKMDKLKLNGKVPEPKTVCTEEPEHKTEEPEPVPEPVPELEPEPVPEPPKQKADPKPDSPKPEKPKKKSKKPVIIVEGSSDSDSDDDNVIYIKRKKKTKNPDPLPRAPEKPSVPFVNPFNNPFFHMGRNNFQ